MYIKPIKKITANISIPGDKSISHRAVMLSSIAKGDSLIHHFLTGEDCLSTIDCFRKMGVDIQLKQDCVHVRGQGLRGLKEPVEMLDAGNSGTTIRLLTGILSGQSFESRITGDDSLRKRPMDRVIVPLRQMGAKIQGIEKENVAPLSIGGGSLKGIHYASPIASAQVKSAVLLAGLYAQGTTSIQEPYPSRDHTEIMLQDMGGNIGYQEGRIICEPAQQLYGKERKIPGDISSAAFFLVLGSILENSEILMEGVGINPTRTGIMDALIQMGAHIEALNKRRIAGEWVADLKVRSAKLRGIEIGGAMIPRLIDEIPVLGVAACFAQGTTVIRDAKELKVKESNRLDALVSELRKIGAEIEALEDGMVIHGGNKLTGGEITSYGDHRIAMAMTIGGLASREGVMIDCPECTEISFPHFYSIIERIMSDGV